MKTLPKILTHVSDEKGNKIDVTTMSPSELSNTYSQLTVEIVSLASYIRELEETLSSNKTRLDEFLLDLETVEEQANHLENKDLEKN